MTHHASSTRSVSYVSQLLSARYGPAPSGTTLGSLRLRNPHLDRFDWSLFIIWLEIDLKVRIPPRVIDDNRMTIAQFARKVVSLPKVTEVNYTLDMLTMLAQALLSVDDARAPSPQLHRKKPGRQR